MPDISPTNKRNVHHRPNTPFILVPLYIYPHERGDSWAPLFEAINGYQDVSFVVIVNPESGPGRSHKPDENYNCVLKALTHFENVTILGYVPVCWAERELTEASRDITAYYSWEEKQHEEKSPNIRIDGIFFDEAPCKDTEENLVYMAKAAELVRRLASSHHRPWNIIRQNNERAETRSSNDAQADDLRPNNKQCTVIYNPGTPPAAGSPFFDSDTQADYIVIFEQTLDTWPPGIPLPNEVAAPVNCSSFTPESSESNSSSSSSSDIHITTSSEPDQTPEAPAVIPDPGREYISRCLEALSPPERAQSIAIAHSVSSLSDQIAFVAQAVAYGLAGHFATSTADYASWGIARLSSHFVKEMKSQDITGRQGEKGDWEPETEVPWLAYVAAASRLSQGSSTSLSHQKRD